VHAIFLCEEPGAGLEERVAATQGQAAAKGSGDTARLVGCTLFLHTPGGYGRSELAALLTQLLPRRGGAPNGTAVTGRRSPSCSPLPELTSATIGRHRTRP
jgi:hypothetical protein